MSRRLAVLPVLGLLVLALPGSAAGQPLERVDAHIASVGQLLDAARFEQAVTEAEVGLALLGDSDAAGARQRAARLDVLAATAELAFGREDDARRRLGRALRNEPDLELTESEAPRKLRRVMAEVRAAHAANEPKPKPIAAVSRAAAAAKARPRPSTRRSPRPAARPEEVVIAAVAPRPPVSAPPPSARWFVPLARAQAALSRTLLASAVDGEQARVERWEIRPEDAAAVRLEIARRRIDGRLHVLEHVRIEGDPGAELRLLSVESARGSGTDRILFQPASGRARRLGAERVPLMPASLPVRFEDLKPPRLEDLELVSAHGEDRDAEPVWVVEARPRRAHTADRIELVIAEEDGRLLERRWYREGVRAPFRTVRTLAADPTASDAADRAWRLADRERGIELDVRLLRRIERPAPDPSVFSLARLRGADAPIPIPESR